MRRALMIAILFIMLLVALITEGELRAYLELAGFVLLLLLLFWRHRRSGKQQIGQGSAADD